MAVDCAGVISVKMPEDVLPLSNVLPEPYKFVEANGSRSIGVKDVHKHLAGVDVERSHVSINECALELFGGDRTRAIGINSDKPSPKGRISTRRRLASARGDETTADAVGAVGAVVRRGGALPVH